MMDVVLVDDKKDIVRGIAAAVDWKARDVQMHGFFNGADALAYCLDNPPDLVITDIRMPFMTGLELMAALKEHGVETRVVLLTGYEDFAYAREALRLGAVEYLTKPVRVEAIQELIDREYKIAVQHRRDKDAQIEEWRRYQRSLPALRRQWLESLAQGKTLKQESLCTQLAELGFDLNPDHLLFAVVSLAEDGDEVLASDEQELMRYAVSNIGLELIRASFPCECVDLGKDRLAFLLNYPGQSTRAEVNRRVEALVASLADKCSEILHVSLAGGIGSCAAGAGDLRTSWEDAVRAMERNFFMDKPTVFSVCRLPGETVGWEQKYPYNLQDEAIQLLRRRELNQARRVMDELFDRLTGMTEAPSVGLREHLLSFLLRLFHECDLDQYLHVASALDQFRSKRNLPALREWFDSLTAYLKDQMDENASQIAAGVYKVKRYIDQNYAENINLKNMASLAFVSPAYLSISFKEVLGVNFNEYLTTVRMERAKELLSGGNIRVYEVCELVGYHDKKYFSELFKKHVGVYPKDWKEGTT